MVARSVYGHVIIKFSRMGRLLHFLTYGAAGALRYKLLDKDKCDIQHLFTVVEVASGSRYLQGPRSGEVNYHH